MTLGELLTRLPLRMAGDSPVLDAQVILAEVLKKSRTWLLAHPETTLAAPELEAVEAAVSRLEAGEPLPYVIGHWEFYGFDLDLTPDVLIPRPETETLVGRAIAWLKDSPHRRTVADVGTGSGAIAVAIASHVPDACVLATDISLAALRVALRNARKFDLDSRVDFVQCDLLPPHHASIASDLHFDLICANLPYIPSVSLRSLPVFGREPRLALDGGAEGLDLIRRLLLLAMDWLAPNGLILLEIEAAQGMQAVSLAYDSYADAEIHLHQDPAGHDRLLEIAL
jgi:release factor glutamine methyltransferase